jgi:uncharacterized protein
MIVNGVINFPVKVAKSKIHGNGCYAATNIDAKRKIGSLAGKIISKKEGRLKVKNYPSISLVELWNGKSLDASEINNELRYINHSCQPNTYMRTFNNHVEFYTLRKIKTGEELTCNYGLTHHDGNRMCTCGANGCTGFI